MRTGVRARAVFVNDCPEATVGVAWIDFECKERAPHPLLPGQSMVSDTFVAHSWRLRDAVTGALLREFAPAVSSRTVLVRACACSGAAEALIDEAEAPDGGWEWPDAGAEEPFDAGIVPCPPRPAGARRSACSLATRTAPVTVTFVNNCIGTRVETWWVDYQCKEKRYRPLAPGESRTQLTFVGHPWVLRDADAGTLLSEFTAVAPIPAVVPACPCEPR